MAQEALAKLSIDELKLIAEEFAVDLSGVTRKPDILKALETDGVTYEMYKTLVQPADEEAPVELAELDDTPLDATGVTPATEEDDDLPTHIVKMTRKNHSFQIRGYRFSKDNPYALVTAEDADYLIETGGFRPASPKEIKEFYGQV